MSTKLNKIAYNKIALQAEEAKDLGLIKLASDVFTSIGSIARDETIVYGERDLKNDVDLALWKVATDIIAYHDLSSVDIQGIESVINDLSYEIIASIERKLGVEGEVGALEAAVAGQKV